MHSTGPSHHSGSYFAVTAGDSYEENFALDAVEALAGDVVRLHPEYSVPAVGPEHKGPFPILVRVVGPEAVNPTQIEQGLGVRRKPDPESDGFTWADCHRCGVAGPRDASHHHWEFRRDHFDCRGMSLVGNPTLAPVNRTSFAKPTQIVGGLLAPPLLVLVIEHHPHRPLAQLFGILAWHHSILSNIRASTNLGALHPRSSVSSPLMCPIMPFRSNQQQMAYFTPGFLACW